jgi:hypothetical protein
MSRCWTAAPQLVAEVLSKFGSDELQLRHCTFSSFNLRTRNKCNENPQQKSATTTSKLLNSDLLVHSPKHCLWNDEVHEFIHESTALIADPDPHNFAFASHSGNQGFFPFTRGSTLVSLASNAPCLSHVSSRSWSQHCHSSQSHTSSSFPFRPLRYWYCACTPGFPKCLARGADASAPPLHRIFRPAGDAENV